MVSRLLKLFSRDVVSMNQAALVLAVFSVLSQVFGLVRDRLLASTIGPGAVLDVYYAAFRIPDFLYNSFGVLFSVTVLIPFIARFAQEEKEGKDGRLRYFLDNVTTVYIWGMGALCVGVALLMPWLTHLTAPGFSAEQQHTLVVFSRLMLISPFLFGLSSLLSSFAQVKKKFFAYAIAPLFYNAGILTGVLLFLPHWGMLGVVMGVILGAGLYFVVQLPPLIVLQKIPRLVSQVDWRLIKEVIALSLPRTLGSSLTNITFILIAAIASLLATGSISVFQLAYNIENSPLLIFGISYAVAAFPAMARSFSEGRNDEVLRVLYRTTRNIFFFTVPIAFLMIVLRAHVVRVLLGAGAFSWNDTRLVAASVALFCLSVTAQSMVLLLVRGFFATGDTWTPLKINLWAVAGTGAAALGLVYGYHHVVALRYFLDSLLRLDGVEGGSVVLLALAFSIGQTWNALALWKKLHTRIVVVQPQAATLARTLSHMIAAGIIAAGAGYCTLLGIGTSVDQTRFWGIFSQAAVATVVGFGVYGGILWLLGNEDIRLFLGTLKSRFWKEKPPLVQGQQEL
ncbi:hypothetical protein IT401_01045 [Candidatus Nomurabacteria bacterium]|nr:hypothetical protein [Candidatus Nomurabacteria bacterium]